MKNILFTGARSGLIGNVIDKIKNLNYNIYVTVHTEEELLAVKKIYKSYDNITCFKFDVVNDEIDLNNIDVLICNSAVAESGSMFDIPLDLVRTNFEVNYFSTLKLIQNAATYMVPKGDGKIIVMSSLAGRIPMPFLGSYASTKAALAQSMKALRYENKLLKNNIKLCLIEPGLYKTGFNQLAFDKKYEWMDKSYFKDNILFIKKLENLLLKFFEKKNFDSITNKIVKAIINENPRFYYSAPFYQNLFAKIYNLFH
jgi:short-subunit dehydrogenase